MCAPLAVVNIEIKNWPDDKDFDPAEQVAEAVVALVDARGELDDGRNLISCFHLPTVDRVHELAPGLATAWLLGLVRGSRRAHRQGGRARPRGRPPPPRVRERGLRAPRPRRRAGREHVDLRRAGPHQRRWPSSGVDAVVTNVPDVALAALGR